jgi:hypothetical protein
MLISEILKPHCRVNISHCLVDANTGLLVLCGARIDVGVIVGWDTAGVIYVQPDGFCGAPHTFSAESLGLRIGVTI